VKLQAWRAQFSGLDGRHPALWPPLPRTLCAAAVWLLAVAGGGFLWRAQYDDLDQGRQQEMKLRLSFEQKVAQAQHLDRLRRQKAGVEAEVGLLEKQLPGQAEMEALLSAISQAGTARGLQFELFKPAQLKYSDHYAELPIEIRLGGDFHALAGFVSDIANMPRIVTVDGLSMTQQRDSTLSFSCIAHAFRYLDPTEAAQRRQALSAPRKTERK
jgi:type IV pilus assembly protein PilO